MSIWDMNREQFITALSERTSAEDVYLHAHDIYEYMGNLFGENAGDSLLREWAFEWASEGTGQDYDTIYNEWIGA